MKLRKYVWFLSIFLATISLVFSHQVFAGGLYISQVNSPASLGTAGVNNVVNNVAADAAYTNPAGMTGIDRDTLMPGFQLILPKVEFDPSIATAGGNDGGNAGEAAPVPGLNAVKVLSDQWRLGLAITAPVGGGVDYGDNFAGRYSATRSVLTGLGISPSLGYKINDSVSVGIGFTAIYTKFDLDMAIKQSTPLGAPLPDGMVHIDKIDDWSPQGFVGLTWQITDKAMLGVVYRTKSEIELEGDLDIKGLAGPTKIVNAITSRLDKVEVDFDLAQVVTVGLAYDVSDDLIIMVDFDWEDWSEFSDNYISIQSGAITTAIDRKWDDTWHVGVAALYKMDDSFMSAGVGYDSSPVDDDDRTFDLPVDEQLKLGASYGQHLRDNLSWAVGLGYVWLGNGKIDQTSQDVRVKGEFDSNFFVSIGGNMRYLF
jgi:long-chain fatty acid transport protein